MPEENVVVVRFTEPSKAYQALSVLKDCDAEGRIRLESAAIVERTAAGELQIQESDDNVGLVGTASGSLIGMLVGVLGGPVGLLLGWGSGALIGGLFDLDRANESDDALTVLGQAIPPAQILAVSGSAPGTLFNVQVQFSGRPQEPMGRRKYWPIYEACAKHGLQVMSHAFGSYGNPITGAGWPSFYVEEHLGPAQAMQANVISMVSEGVFDHFPTVKVVSVENGFGWLPSLVWRLEHSWRLLKSELPHLKREPAEYVREHLYLTTQPVEEPHKPAYFLQLVEQYGDMIDHLLFASDYPHWDADDPEFALPGYLPAKIRRKIQFENARALHRLD